MLGTFVHWQYVKYLLFIIKKMKMTMPLPILNEYASQICATTGIVARSNSQ